MSPPSVAGGLGVEGRRLRLSRLGRRFGHRGPWDLGRRDFEGRPGGRQFNRWDWGPFALLPFNWLLSVGIGGVVAAAG